MPRPNVSVTVLDESLVVPTSEDTSTTLGSMVSVAGLSLFGTTAEKAQGYYLVNDIPNWFSRLQTFTRTENNLTPTESGVTFIASYLESNGATAWTNEWYSVYNFLQYGAPCYVGFNNTTSGLSGFYSLDVDVIFESATGAKQHTLDFFNHRVSKEAPAFGIFSVTDEITN